MTNLREHIDKKIQNSQEYYPDVKPQLKRCGSILGGSYKLKMISSIL